LILSGANLPLLFLLVLLIAKLVLTPVSIGSGFQGGVFAPSLFLGANLGAAFALVARSLFPGLAIFPQAFAMVGMAAVLAGAVHAPLTAVMLLFEMTNDYRIILPLMAAVIVSMVVSRNIQRDSVYTYSLSRRGLRLDRGRDIDVLQGITVGEVMETDPPCLSERQGLKAAEGIMMRLSRQGMPVINERGDLCGILTISDLRRSQIMSGEDDPPVGTACTRRLLTVNPSDTLDQALKKMGVQDIGRLPVVSPENPHRLVGLLRRSDVIRAYDSALIRRTALRHRMEGSRLGVFTGLEVEEVRIEPGATIVDQQMRGVAWPVDCLVASIQRGRRLIVPHGETELKAGDTLVVVGSEADLVAVRGLCQPQ
ncbi:MAG: CBS domain-containing protein, partial [Anaerolineae bacterium]|nr:CBS domain-containing protein [Anaerolineae bacterium]